MGFKINSLYYSDGYKIGHKAMLAPGTEYLYGTWIPRSIKHAPKGCNKIVSFGQQLVWKWINDEFNDNFFNQSILTADDFIKDMSDYLGMKYDGEHFKELHKLGYLPIKVKSLPEGIETNPNVPHMTFVNTVKGFAWLTLYLETIVSSLAWKPSTSATIALQYKRVVDKWVDKTDPSQSFLKPWLCHDFSARGLSPWDCITSGLGHATSFNGSDTLPVIPAAKYFYNEKDVCIGSVNASEHSVSTTKIFTVGEQQMLSDWMKTFPNGILSVVSDTFDLWKLITEYLPTLKEEILTRDGKLVIRPDSGDPVDIICGDVYRVQGFTEGVLHVVGDGGIVLNYMDNKYYTVTVDDNYKVIGVPIEDSRDIPCKSKGVIELLWDTFGGTINEQGYKVLDPHIGAIYGDSINLDRQEQIYQRLAAKGFAATNIVLGIGSFTYQFNTRDTFGFAAKGAWFKTSDGEYDIYKDPITDDGTKKSYKGKLQVKGDVVKERCITSEEEDSDLQVIFEDGIFYNQTTLTDIRNKLNG